MDYPQLPHGPWIRYHPDGRTVEARELWYLGHQLSYTKYSESGDLQERGDYLGGGRMRVQTFYQNGKVEYDLVRRYQSDEGLLRHYDMEGNLIGTQCFVDNRELWRDPAERKLGPCPPDRPDAGL